MSIACAPRRHRRRCPRLPGRARPAGRAGAWSPPARPASRQRAPRRELDVVEQPSCGLLPDARLRPQALVLLVGPSQDVAVGSIEVSSPLLAGRGPSRMLGGAAARASWTATTIFRREVDAARVRRTVGPCAARCSIAIRSSPPSPIGSSRHGRNGSRHRRRGRGRDRQVEPARRRRAQCRGAGRDGAAGARRPARAGRGVGRRPAAVRPPAARAELERADGRRRRARRTRAASRHPRAGARRGRDARRGARAGVARRQPRRPGADACSSSTTSTGPTRRRCGGWRQLAGRLEELRARRRLRGALGRAARRQPDLLAELLAAAPEGPAASARARPGRRRGARPRGPPGRGPELRARLPRRHRREPVPARRALRQLASERVAPTDAVAAGLSSFGPEQVARSVERRLARLPDGSAALARALAVLGGSAPLRHAARLARLDPEDAATSADALRAAGLWRATRELALTHPLVAGALRASFGAGELAPVARRAASMLAAEGADPERVALHVLRTDPAADPETVALLRAAAERALARGAPESAAAFLRRALVEPPVEPALAADVRLELGLALAAHVLPDAPRLLLEAVELAASPEQRVAIALRGGRALGMAGHFEDALQLCRRGLEHAADVAPEAARRLEAELVCVASVHADSRRGGARPAGPSGRAARRSSSGAPTPPPTRSSAGNPPRDALGLLGPLLEDDGAGGGAGLAAAHRDGARPHPRRRARRRLRALHRAHRPRPSARLAHRARPRQLPPCHRAPAGGPRPGGRDRRAPLLRLQEPPQRAARPALVAVPPRRGADRGGRARGRGRRARRDRAGRSAGGRAHLAAAAAEPRAPAARPAPPRGGAGRRTGRGRPMGEFGHAHPGFATWRVEAVEALVALGEPAAARPLAEKHLALAERVGLPGRSAPACARWPAPRSATSASRCSNAPWTCSPTAPRSSSTRARSSTSAPRCAGPTGGPTPARRCGSRSSSPSTTACGCSPAERARSSTPPGARPRRAALTGPQALTAAEHRVARLAADGAHEPRDRRAALRHAAHGRDAPHPRVREARHRRARGSGRGPHPQRRDHPGARAGLTTAGVSAGSRRAAPRR